jgi:uncharacterized membrane protein
LLVLIIIQRTLIWQCQLLKLQDIVLIVVVYFGIRKGNLCGSISAFIRSYSLFQFFIGLDGVFKATVDYYGFQQTE